MTSARMVSRGPLNGVSPGTTVWFARYRLADGPAVGLVDATIGDTAPYVPDPGVGQYWRKPWQAAGCTRGRGQCGARPAGSGRPMTPSDVSTTRWKYFMIAGSQRASEDVMRVRFARTDPDGARYNCQTLRGEGTWQPSDFLERYILGTNEYVLVDLSEAEVVEQLTRARELGRFPVRPTEPAGVGGP